LHNVNLLDEAKTAEDIGDVVEAAHFRLEAAFLRILRREGRIGIVREQGLGGDFKRDGARV